MFTWISRCLIACIFAGCTYKKDKDHDKVRETLYLNIPSDPVSFDPHMVRSLKDITIMKQLFDGLMRLDETGKPVPAIAENVTISEDGLTYTFSLRDSYWINGDRVCAYDFLYAWRKVLDHNYPSDYAHLLYPIKNAKKARNGACSVEDVGIAVLNSRTFVVTLGAPTPYFLELTTLPIFYPENSKIGFACTNGPFALESWRPHQELILQKSSSYWDHEAVNLGAIHFSIIADSLTESYLFERGELDWLGSPISNTLPTEIIEKMKQEGKLDSHPVAGTVFFKCNTRSEPFCEPLIRKAFASAINRSEIVSHILQGGQCVATGLLPPAMSLQKEPFFKDADGKRASQLFEQGLEARGWTRQTLAPIVLNYSPSERSQKIAQLIQQQIAHNLGIEIKLEAQERFILQGNMKQGNFQISAVDWFADFNDPLSFLELFKYKNEHELSSGMNETGWENTVYCALLDQALLEQDQIKRFALLQQAESLLIDEMPIIPLYHCAFDYLKKDNVRQVILSPLGSADFKRAVLR